MQASLDGGDRLFVFSKEDRLDAKLASSSDISLDIVQKDDLCWLHAKSFTGQFKDAPLRLGNPLLVGVNKEIA